MRNMIRDVSCCLVVAFSILTYDMLLLRCVAEVWYACWHWLHITSNCYDYVESFTDESIVLWLHNHSELVMTINTIYHNFLTVRINCVEFRPSVV